MSTRKICPTCNTNPVAINYVRKEKVYYRRLCLPCIRKGRRIKPTPPAWYRAGYRKKDCCEKCGVKAKYPADQLRVFYVDGNMKNVDWSNFRTVCLLCQIDIQNSTLPWRPAGIVPDF